jgi:ABC-2 type transport system permease protein
MTLFLREIKGNLKSFTIWTACIAGMMAIFMAVYPSFAAQGSMIDEMLKGFSPDLLKMLSFDALDFTKAPDYYAYVFQYILLATMIQFMMMGAGLISREEDSGTINFLYAKPLSRTSIVGEKLFAGITYIAAFFVIYTACTWATLAAVSASAVDLGQVAVFSAALVLGQLMMLGLGLLFSMFVTKTRAIMSTSIGVVLGLYVLSMFVNMKDELKGLKYITPFQYFDSRAILRGGIDWLYIVLAIAVAAVCVAASLSIYNRRDLKC